MQVNGTSSATSTPPSTSTASSTASAAATANYNTFLQLLVTEMQNQDPTKPMDPTQTVSQLATFSQVEQAVQTNSKLDSILATSALSQASSMIGRTVTSADGTQSGVITSVTTSSSGLSAQLKDGTTISLTSGVTVS